MQCITCVHASVEPMSTETITHFPYEIEMGQKKDKKKNNNVFFLFSIIHNIIYAMWAYYVLNIIVNARARVLVNLVCDARVLLLLYAIIVASFHKKKNEQKKWFKKGPAQHKGLFHFP